MGLGKLLTRSTEYVATNTVTNEVQTFTIVDNLAPDWPSSTYRGGMGIPGAWRAATLLSGLIGSVPWNAYRSAQGRPTDVIYPTPPLLAQPNPPDTALTSFSSMALDYYWHGNAIALVASRNREGWPTAAYLIPATSVGVRRVPAPGMSTLPVGAIEYSVGTMRNLGVNDVIHIKAPCEPGALRGMGVLEAHLNTLDLSAELSRQARSITRHGVPTGVLTSDNPDTTDEELRAAKTAWLAAQRDRTVAALRPGTDFKPLSWNPEELELIAARQFNLTEWELIFGLPVGWLGGNTNSRTYANVEADAVSLLKFSLGIPLVQFEQTLTLHLPRGTVAKANLDEMLRGDTLTRFQAYAIGLQNQPFLTVDEVRAQEGRPPMPARSAAPPAPAPNSQPDDSMSPQVVPAGSMMEGS